jgi:hypothetical protein
MLEASGGGDREEEKVAWAWWHKSIMYTNLFHKRKDCATQSASRIVLITPWILGVTRSLSFGQIRSLHFCFSETHWLSKCGSDQLTGKCSKRKVDTREYLPTRRSWDVCWDWSIKDLFLIRRTWDSPARISITERPPNSSPTYAWFSCSSETLQMKLTVFLSHGTLPHSGWAEQRKAMTDKVIWVARWCSQHEVTETPCSLFHFLLWASQGYQWEAISQLYIEGFGHSILSKVKTSWSLAKDSRLTENDTHGRSRGAPSWNARGAAHLRVCGLLSADCSAVISVFDRCPVVTTQDTHHQGWMGMRQSFLFFSP